jgi:membrane associated rhomboid family serine protease
VKPVAQDQPMFNGPRIVVVLLGLLVAIHVGRQLLGEEEDQWLVLAMAFIPARYAGVELPGGEVAKFSSFLTHALLHGDFLHLAVNSGWLLAFGSILARRIDALRFVGLAAICAVAGAASFLAVNWGLLVPMIGASGAISGMMGAAMRFMFVPGEDGRAMTFMQMMQDRRARTMILSWVALNLLFGLLLGNMLSAGGIAWEAHLGGFLAGMALFPLFDAGARPLPPTDGIDIWR